MQDRPDQGTSRSSVRLDAVLATAKRLIGRYGLQNPRIEPAHAGGFTNDNLAVSDDDGAWFLLRRYRKQTDVERVGLQIRFQGHIERGGVPVAPLIETVDGEMIVTADGSPWVLCRWVDGAGYDFEQAAQAVEAGRVLALLHKAGEGFDSGVGRAPPDRRSVRRTFTEYVSTAHSQPGLLSSLFPGQGAPDEVAYACSWWERVAKEWPPNRLQALPHTWLHGDYHGMNTVFAGDRMEALLDFDDIWFGPRICDVAQGFFNFGRRMRGISHATGRQMRADFGRRFLEGYQSVIDLSRAEYEALPSVAPNVIFPPDGVWLNELRDGGQEIRARLRRDVAITRDIAAEMLRIAPDFGWAGA